MLTTPPVKEFATSCTEQIVHPKPMPTPALTPNTNPYAPSADDVNKIKDAITILERVSRSQGSAEDKESIQRVIQQLNTDLMYLKIKNNG
jgi:hypothetical protein